MLELSGLAEDSLAELLETAVADADPAEVMAPVPGETGWTERQRQGFLEFHRGRSIGTAHPVERTYVIRHHGRVVGAARLEPTAAGLEAGIWLGRSARGTGIGRAVLAELVALAREQGGHRLIATTTSDNTAARGLLAGMHNAGLRSTEHDGQVDASLDLSGR